MSPEENIVPSNLKQAIMVLQAWRPDCAKRVHMPTRVLIHVSVGVSVQLAAGIFTSSACLQCLDLK